LWCDFFGGFGWFLAFLGGTALMDAYSADEHLDLRAAARQFLGRVPPNTRHILVRTATPRCELKANRNRRFKLDVTPVPIICLKENIHEASFISSYAAIYAITPTT
jgi:hypothetical protein